MNVTDSGLSFPLAGRVAIVTGASSGIGAETAGTLAARGCRVVGVDITPPPAGGASAGADHRALDVTDEGAWKRLVVDIEAEHERIDVLISSAAILRWGAVHEASVEDFRAVLDVNVVGTFLGMRYVVPGMRRRRVGSIVNISSVAGLMGHPDRVAYAASKWAVRGLTKAAAKDLTGTGVRVNSVHPGPVRTAMTHGLSDDVCARQPLARRAEPSEVAAVIAFLAGDESSYCTGAEFVVDGGHSLG